MKLTDDEIDALIAELAAAKAGWMRQISQCSTLSSQIDRLEAECDALRPDAETMRKIVEIRKGKKLGVGCGCEFDDNETELVTCDYHKALRADAERWRFVRKHWHDIVAPLEGSDPNAIDAEIDRAIAAEARQK